MAHTAEELAERFGTPMFAAVQAELRRYGF